MVAITQEQTSLIPAQEGFYLSEHLPWNLRFLEKFHRGRTWCALHFQQQQQGRVCTKQKKKKRAADMSRKKTKSKVCERLPLLCSQDKSIIHRLIFPSLLPLLSSSLGLFYNPAVAVHHLSPSLFRHSAEQKVHVFFSSFSFTLAHFQQR